MCNRLCFQNALNLAFHTMCIGPIASYWAYIQCNSIHTHALAFAMGVYSTCLCGLIKYSFSESLFCASFLDLCSPSKQVTEAAGTGFCLGALAGLIWH